MIPDFIEDLESAAERSLDEATAGLPEGPAEVEAEVLRRRLLDGREWNEMPVRA